jgi:predicted transposase YbfD/YdcC
MEEGEERNGNKYPIMRYFTGIPDPRKEVNKKYPLYEIVAITILAVISFAKGWEDIERYGKAKRRWLSKYLELKNGIPKHDVYRRVFTVLRPELIETCFMNWVRAIKQNVPREIIAIDGKTAKGSFNAEAGKALHIVSAWATANRLVFGQVKTDDKSNEITAIPVLLDKIALEGCIVSIDAMGCQYEIADKIVRKKADYLFSLKGNQGNLHEDVKEYFMDFDFSKPSSAMKYISFQSTSTHEEKRGRIEDRDYAVSDDVKWLHKRHRRWKTIRSIGFVDCRREEKGKVTYERRYFVSSLPCDASEFAKAVRAHWGIENSLHYVLDVAFGEDGSRIRSDKGPENMSFIRKIALTIARLDTETKSSVTGRIKQMAWSEDYLEQMLFASPFAPPQED